MYCLCSILIGKCIDFYTVCHHESRIEAQSEMSDNLILICLIFVLCKECFCTRKSNLTDVFFYFFCGHAKTIIDEFQSFVLVICHDSYFKFGIVRNLIFSHHIQLL